MYRKPKVTVAISWGVHEFLLVIISASKSQNPRKFYSYKLKISVSIWIAISKIIPTSKLDSKLYALAPSTDLTFRIHPTNSSVIQSLQATFHCRIVGKYRMDFYSKERRISINSQSTGSIASTLLCGSKC